MPHGRGFEYVFETHEPETIDRDKAEEIAAEWILSFHRGPQILESRKTEGKLVLSVTN